MRVLLIYNRYLKRGGEDVCLETETALLRAAGHSVELLIFDNADLKRMRSWQQLVTLFHNRRAVAAVRAAMASFAPEVVHVHNFAYYASPAILSAVHKRGCPLVMTLHNYRLVCVGAQLLRGGRLCKRCVQQRWPLWGAYYGCFQGSRLRSLLLQLSISYHKWRGTFDQIDRFIVPKAFSRDIFVNSSLQLPANRFKVKVHSTAPQQYVAPSARGERFLYVGRLSYEKGTAFLLRLFEGSAYEVDIIGAGPLVAAVRAAARGKRMCYHGEQSAAFVQRHMGSCKALLLPSTCYETGPYTVLEAYAQGTPVISSDNAALRQVVLHEESGLLCPAEDLASWQAALQRIQDNKLHNRLCQGARRQYEERFTHERNTRALLGVYQEVIAARQHAQSKAGDSGA